MSISNKASKWLPPMLTASRTVIAVKLCTPAAKLPTDASEVQKFLQRSAECTSFTICAIICWLTSLPMRCKDVKWDVYANC
jgi:hypothetical protein